MTGLDYLNKFRQELIKNTTFWEKKIYTFLQELNIEFEFQKIILTPNGCYIVDFYLPKYNVIVECDGLFHYDRYNRDKDYIRDKNIKKYFKSKSILRLKNTKINKLDINKFKSYLDSRINGST